MFCVTTRARRGGDQTVFAVICVYVASQFRVTYRGAESVVETYSITTTTTTTTRTCTRQANFDLREWRRNGDEEQMEFSNDPRSATTSPYRT